MAVAVVTSTCGPAYDLRVGGADLCDRSCRGRHVPPARHAALLEGRHAIRIGGVSNTVCYHRALAHRALWPRPVVREILSCFTLGVDSSGTLRARAADKHTKSAVPPSQRSSPFSHHGKQTKPKIRAYTGYEAHPR